MSRVELPEECRVGEHEPALRIRNRAALVANRCGRCGREIERQSERQNVKPGEDPFRAERGDPWMTQEQHDEERRELEADEIPLPEPCPVGQHEPAIVHRSGGPSAKVANVCGRCGREIERQTEEGGRSDPWMTEEQHREEIRELEADERIGEATGAERCPPRE